MIVIAPHRHHSKPMTSSTSSNFEPGAPFDFATVSEAMKIMGHSHWLGMKRHAEGADWVELALPWHADIVADPVSGVLASGPIISLMDNATGIAVWKKRGLFLPQVTVDLRVDYMRPARPGATVIGRGECYKITRNFAFVRGVAYDESLDDPVAHVVGSFILVGGETPA